MGFYTLHPTPYTLFSGAVSISGPEFLISMMSFLLIAGSVGFAFTPIGRAIARRLGGAGPDGEAQREVASLREEVDQLRGELGEMQGRVAELDDLHNRVDFAERLIAQVKTKGAFPGQA
ncbi:MAG: hypothetical protein Q7J79_07575 [Gemmatimonadales bacterium]|nr:hypothetical protein [Gemmatimonadales bacterium]